MQKEVNEDSKKPQQEYVPSTNQKANSKQINRLLNESSASNTYRNSKLNANNKYNSPTQNSSSHKPKSQNVIMQNAQNLSQQQKNESEGGANNNIDEQNIIKVNNKVRTIFRGGIIGMMQGKAKKKKTQFSRDNLNSKQKEVEFLKFKQKFSFKN